MIDGYPCRPGFADVDLPPQVLAAMSANPPTVADVRRNERAIAEDARKQRRHGVKTAALEAAGLL